MNSITLFTFLTAQALTALLFICLGRDFAHEVALRHKPEARRPLARIQTAYVLHVMVGVMFLLLWLSTTIDPSI